MELIDAGDLAFERDLPPKLIKALAVIANTMHVAFDAQPWIAHQGKSKDSCVLCSLTVRDFLRAIGFDDAEVRTVCVIMRATRGGEQLHSLGIGHPSDTAGADDGRYPLHMVATLRRSRVLIDTTLFLSKRPAWPQLPGMMAVRVDENTGCEVHGMRAIAGCSMDNPADDYDFTILWLDRPLNAWRQSGDARETWRRAPIIAAMVEQFGEWRD